MYYEHVNYLAGKEISLLCLKLYCPGYYDTQYEC